MSVSTDPIEAALAARINYREFITLLLDDPQWSWSSRWWQAGCVIVRSAHRSWEQKSPLDGMPADIEALGCSGHDQSGQLHWIGFDLDVGHGGVCYGSLDEAMADARRLREALGEAEIRRSRSGGGLHVKHLLPLDCGLTQKDAARVVKYISRKLGIKADPSNLGRQAFWLWTRQPAEHAFEELAEQEKPVLDLAEIIIEAMAASDAEGKSTPWSGEAVAYDPSASDDTAEDAALAAWEPGSFSGRSPLGNRNWADVRHFVNDWGLSVDRALQLISDRGGDPCRSAKQWERMLRYCRYPGGWAKRKASIGTPAATALTIPSSPAPLQPTTPDEAWPVGCLVPSVRDFVGELACSAQTPVDLPAQLCLGVLSALCARGVRVEWQAGKTEPVNMYLITALEPSERKSTVVKAVAAPLLELESAKRLAAAAEIMHWQSERKLMEKKIENCTSKIAKGTSNQSELRTLVDKLHEHLSHEPIDPRLIVDDVTHEALATLLRRNSSIAMISAECGLLDNLSARYGGDAPSLNPYLKYWSGDHVVIDRASGRSETLLNPLLTISTTTQPATLVMLGQVRNSRRSGLLSRFLYSIPRSMVGERLTDTPGVTPITAGRWSETVTRLSRLGQCTLTLTPEARGLLLAFSTEIESRVRAGSDLRRLADWAGKLQVGQLARLAGILHCCEHLAPQAMPISGATMTRALALARYYILQAKTAFGLMECPHAGIMKSIDAWIREGNLKEFTTRDAYKRLHISKAEIEPALDEMAAEDAIKRKDKFSWAVHAVGDSRSEHCEPVTVFEAAAEPSSPPEMPAEPLLPIVPVIVETKFIEPEEFAF